MIAELILKTCIHCKGLLLPGKYNCTIHTVGREYKKEIPSLYCKVCDNHYLGKELGDFEQEVGRDLLIEISQERSEEYVFDKILYIRRVYGISREELLNPIFKELQKEIQSAEVEKDFVVPVTGNVFSYIEDRIIEELKRRILG